MRLALGTAQLGLAGYGISNDAPPPGRAEAVALVREALASGFELVDTAPHYGDAEAIVGDAGGGSAGVVTRTPAYLSRLGAEAAARRVRDGLAESLRALRVERLDAWLVHSTEDLLGPTGEAVWSELVAAREDGRAARIGCTAYDGEQLDRLLERFPLEVVQVPLNVLDRRLVASGHLSRLRERGVEVHARSAFLQGLLLMDPDALPPAMAFARPVLECFRELVRSHGWTPLEAALGSVLATPEVDVVSVGVAERSQLAAVARAAASPPLRAELAVLDELARDDPRLVDPSRWPNPS